MNGIEAVPDGLPDLLPPSATDHPDVAFVRGIFTHLLRTGPLIYPDEALSSWELEINAGCKWNRLLSLGVNWDRLMGQLWLGHRSTFNQ